MLELDLIGHRLTISDSEARLLLSVAEEASGSSIGSRDLATRLKALADPVASTRRRLVFSRPESRALQRMIQSRFESTDDFQDLRLTLSELLA